MRARRPSLTATLVAGVRAVYAGFPPDLRAAPDPHAAALVPAWLALEARASTAAPWAAPFVHQALGLATLGLSWHVALRTLAIDDALRAALAAGARQVVLLGAGLDNRASRLPEIAAAGARVLEVDHPDMQREKRARLAAAAVPEHARTMVPVDFETERLDASLGRAGFSRELVTFWIWEGVTAYLTRPAIEETLRAVRDLSAPGSRLAVTYMRPGMHLGPNVERLAATLGRLVGEDLRTQLHVDEMAALLASHDFTVLSDEADIDLASRYWNDPPAARPLSMRVFPEWERLVLAGRAKG